MIPGPGNAMRSDGGVGWIFSYTHKKGMNVTMPS